MAYHAGMMTHGETNGRRVARQARSPAVVTAILLTLAGARAPDGLDSIGFVAELTGKGSARPRHEFLYWEFHERGFSQAVLCEGRWKGIRERSPTASLALYDLQNDAAETNDVAARNPAMMARIEAYLKTARTESPDWPAREPPAAPVRIILDTDMSGDCDDAGALAVLHALADAGECRLLATVVNRKDKTGASSSATDAINTWYGRPDLPIGTDKQGPTALQRTSAFTRALRDEFPNDVGPDDRAPDAFDIYRRVLAAQPDGSVTICSVGALSNLAELRRRAPDLVRAKVRRLVVMGGQYPKSVRPETNILTHREASRFVAQEWPGEIVWHGWEVGQALFTGAALQQAPTNNPVRRAYELKPFDGRPAIEGGQPSWDQGAALYAVRGAQSEFWEVVRGGRVVVDGEGNTTWTPDPTGRHAYVKIAGAPAKLAAVMEELMARPPRRPQK